MAVANGHAVGVGELPVRRGAGLRGQRRPRDVVLRDRGGGRGEENRGDSGARFLSGRCCRGCEEEEEEEEEGGDVGERQQQGRRSPAEHGLRCCYCCSLSAGVCVCV